MKTIVTAAIICIAFQLFAYDQSKIYALTHNGAKVDTFVRVVDDEGEAISNASICVAFDNGIARSLDTFCNGKTDKEGFFRIRGKCKYGMTINAEKDGFYKGDFHDRLSEMTTEPAVIKGMWVTPSTGYRVVLKRAKHPIALSKTSPQGEHRNIPAFDKWIGYDLEKWDFCPPFGMGKSEDVLLRFTKEEVGRKYGNYSLELSFTNNPCAGFYVQKRDKNSALWFDYEARTNRNDYISYVKYEYLSDINETTLKWSKLDAGEYMVIRTRTKLDEDGNIIAANYARLLGSIRYIREFTFTQGWFNPNVNDPNLEDGEYWEYLERERREQKQKEESKRGFLDFLK